MRNIFVYIYIYLCSHIYVCISRTYVRLGVSGATNLCNNFGAEIALAPASAAPPPKVYMCYTKYMYIRIYIYIYMDGKSAMWVCLVWLRHVRLFGTYFNSKLNSIPFDSIRGSRLVVTRLAWQLFWLKTHRHTNTLTVCLPE